VTIQDKLKIQTYLSIVIVIAGATHVLFGIYFVYQGMRPVAALNAFDVLVYIVAFFINRAGKTRIASFVIVLKIVLFSLTSTLLFGSNIDAHWFVMVAALPAALYLDFTNKQRICIVAAMPFLISLQLAFPLWFYPPFNMDDNTLLRFLFANIIVLSFILAVSLNAIITRKISDLQTKEIDAYRHKSNIDPMTSLNNRRYAELFFEKLSGDSPDKPLLFCLIDIDDFKSINDTYGHDAGDAVLLATADILRRNTRQTDLVCRWGGEEFLIGFIKCTPEIGRKLLEKIRKAVEDEVIQTESGEIAITITCGASILTDSSIKEALSNADKNLYEGKRSGKNKVVI